MKNWLKVFFISLIFIGIHYTSAIALAESEESTFISYNSPNAPVLYKDMVPIKWNGSEEVEVNNDDKLDWYNYENKKWANAKDGEGNYWVWIPRYTYKISGSNINIIWSSGTKDYIEDGYMIHPAFITDAYIGGDPSEYGSYKNGTGRNELTGFWVAKYMASDNDGKVSIRPNKQPDVSKNIGQAFKACLNMDNNVGISIHLIKASEWGAVAYLTKALGVIPVENGTSLTGINVSSSNTNNYYGVFDMNGPTGEYLSAFVMKDNVLNASALDYVGNMLDVQYENFVDIVSLTENDNASNNESRLRDFYGFAIYESKNFMPYDTENVPTGSDPFFSKGGSGVGLFGYDKTRGDGLGYRPTLSVYSSYLSDDIAFFDTEASVVAGDYLVLSVNFSVDEKWKFDLNEDEVIIENGRVVSGKEKRIFDFIDLRYVQSNNSITLTNGNLNECLIGIIEGDKTLTRLDDSTELKANTQYTIRVRVGGYNDENVPVFLAIPGMTSKIVVNNIDVKSAPGGADLKISSILNNKVRLSIYDSDGRVPVLTGVKLICAPDKTDYYLGERLSLLGGKLEVSYGDNNAIVDLTQSNVVNYETVTSTVGNNKLVELVYEGTTVTQDDVEFRINVNGNEKFYVSGNSLPNNTAVIVSGIGQYEAGDTVNLKASVYPGYKFSNWYSPHVTISGASDMNSANFTMPNKDVTVTANTIGVMSLDVVNPKTEFERGEAFGIGEGSIVAHYPDGTSETLTINSLGVTSTPNKNQVLDELGEKDVTIRYGGAEANYKINVVKEKYNLTFYIDSSELGSIKIGETTVVPVDDKLSTTLRVSYDDFVNVEAVPAGGYSFYGWYVSEESLIPEEYLIATNISFVMPQKNLILKANFIKAHTVKYLVNNENYGQIVGETEQIVKNGENASEVTAVAKDGYKFKEWSDGRTTPDRLDQYVTENATYTAKFVKTWTVQYLVDGVTFATRTVEDGANGYISEIPSKYGYVFSNWDKNLECVTSDIVTNAVFLPWISLDPNGSIDANDFVETHITGRNVKENTFEYIISESISDTGENISDYISNETFNFEGSWEKDGELYRSYVNLASKEDSSTTITIFSNNDKEIVRFDYMFAVTSGQLLGITINGTRVTEYDEEINVWHNLNREVNTVDGKIVVGISYSQDSVYLDSDYAAIKNLRIGRHWTKISSEYDLKDNAIWSENYVHVRGVFPYDNGEVTYQIVSEMFKGDNNNTGDLFTITYELNDGVDPGNPISYTKDTDDITLINPVKNGAEFLGWTGSNGATPSTRVIIPKGSTGNRSYVANWKEEIYTITYDLNGGTVNGTNPTSYTKGSPDITLINPTKAGYTFAGWTGTGITLSGVGSMSVTIPTGSTGNRSYKAMWIKDLESTYTIKYKLNGGILEIENPASYTPSTPTFELVNPIKDGSKFLGWTGSNGTEPEEKVVIEKGSTGNRVYTANWAEQTYRITWENYDGTELKAENVKAGTLPAYSGATPTRASTTLYEYTFSGWSPTIVKVTQNATYTAQFTEKLRTYTVSFDGNGATSGTMASQMFTAGRSAKLTSNSFVKTGYIFNGWNTKANGTGTSYANNASYTATSNITLYAKWKAANAAPTTPTVTLSSKTTSSFVVKAVSTDADGDNLIYKLYVDGTLKSTSASTKSGTATTFTVTGLGEYTSHNYYVIVSDGTDTAQSSTASVRTYCSGTGLTCDWRTSGTKHSYGYCSYCGGDRKVKFCSAKRSWGSDVCLWTCIFCGKAVKEFWVCEDGHHMCGDCGEKHEKMVECDMCEDGYDCKHKVPYEHYSCAHYDIRTESSHSYCTHGKTSQHD